MKKILIFFFLLFGHTNSYCIDKSKQFTVNLSTLNIITDTFKNNRHIFDDNDYSSFILYRGIILNDYIQNGNLSKHLKMFFCQDDTDDMLLLLKWKITITYTDEKLIESGITCNKVIKQSKQLMESHFLDSLYVDAFLEYYNVIKKDSSYDLYEKWSILNSNLYKTPDIDIAEQIIDVQHEIFKKTGRVSGLWNISIIAAKYGSDKGFLNLVNILKDLGGIDYKFLSKIMLLNKGV